LSHFAGQPKFPAGIQTADNTFSLQPLATVQITYPFTIVKLQNLTRDYDLLPSIRMKYRSTNQNAEASARIFTPALTLRRQPQIRVSHQIINNSYVVVNVANVGRVDVAKIELNPIEVDVRDERTGQLIGYQAVLVEASRKMPFDLKFGETSTLFGYEIIANNVGRILAARTRVTSKFGDKMDVQEEDIIHTPLENGDKFGKDFYEFTIGRNPIVSAVVGRVALNASTDSRTVYDLRGGNGYLTIDSSTGVSLGSNYYDTNILQKNDIL
jgi:hypothetical protein